MAANSGTSLPTVTFVCPACITGGPEAIHQAAMAVRAAGLQAEIVYYSVGSRPLRVGDQVKFEVAGENPCLSVFAPYEPKPAPHVLVSENSIVVLPEVLIGEIDAFRGSRIVIWWLSVDNALISCASLREREGCQAFLERGEIEHWYQSDYAKRFLIANGARSARRLSDFTHSSFKPAVVGRPNTGNRILYNRRKGATLARHFFDANRHFEAVALDGLDRTSLIAAYRSGSVYVDFGTLPGKDRMPREAAACGCTIFLHQVGSGRELGDFPVNDIFRFATSEVDSGQLAAKLQFALSNPSAVWELQTVMRETVRQERVEFFHDALLIAGSWGALDASRIAPNLVAA